MNNFLSVIAIIILPWVRISVFWEAALMCHGGSWGTQMLLDSSSLFSGSLNPVSWEGCAPLLKQLSATYALISWWVCISGLMRVALMTLPVRQDAAAARRDPRAARGVLWPSQRNPSCTEVWSVSSAQVPLSQKTNQGCCQPVSGPCNLFRIPVCAWDWVEVLLENVSHCGEKILGKMKKIHMTLCLVLLYFFTSTEKKKISWYCCWRKTNESIFSSSFQNEARLWAIEISHGRQNVEFRLPGLCWGTRAVPVPKAGFALSGAEQGIPALAPAGPSLRCPCLAPLRWPKPSLPLRCFYLLPLAHLPHSSCTLPSLWALYFSGPRHVPWEMRTAMNKLACTKGWSFCPRQAKCDFLLSLTKSQNIISLFL